MPRKASNLDLTSVNHYEFLQAMHIDKAHKPFVVELAEGIESLGQFHDSGKTASDHT
ncbi:hypothetical protein AF72_01150 [Xylella taiwanensis]|uniref:Uncharacterized protein n=1 Tax=Xylella taiwanensis TaxID=1444770 RepID=Z9JN99_9GAMM|nr:hypothetical protein AF72_01150 [Xylella taiwanensis]